MTPTNAIVIASIISINIPAVVIVLVCRHRFRKFKRELQAWSSLSRHLVYRAQQDRAAGPANEMPHTFTS